MKKILCIYCAGGFGKEIYDIALRVNKIKFSWKEIVFVDDNPNINKKVYGTKVYNFNYLLNSRDVKSLDFVIANGEPRIRKTLFEKVNSLCLNIVNLIDPSSIVSNTVNFGLGIIICPFCSISSSVKIDDNVAINTNTIVGHDIHIKKNTVLSSFVNIGGSCILGSNSYIGMGVQIKEGLSIGKNTIVSMGSVVFRDIIDDVIAVGNPARVSRKNKENIVFK